MPDNFDKDEDDLRVIFVILNLNVEAKIQILNGI